MEINIKIEDDSKAQTILSLLKELPFVEIKIKNMQKKEDKPSKSRKERLLSFAGSWNDMPDNEFKEMLTDFKKRRKTQEEKELTYE